MYKKTVTYTDYLGNERTEDFLFNLSEAELIELQHSVDGGLAGIVTKIIKTHDEKQMVTIFKDLLLRAYGEISNDGKYFLKKDHGEILADRFAQSPAYSVIFMELASDDKAAAEFLNGIIPADLAQKVNAEVTNGNITPMTTPASN